MMEKEVPRASPKVAPSPKEAKAVPNPLTMMEKEVPSLPAVPSLLTTMERAAPSLLARAVRNQVMMMEREVKVEAPSLLAREEVPSPPMMMEREAALNLPVVMVKVEAPRLLAVMTEKEARAATPSLPMTLMVKEAEVESAYKSLYLSQPPDACV